MRDVIIVGMGPGVSEQLTQAVHDALSSADIVIGSQRMVQLAREVRETREAGAATHACSYIVAVLTDDIVSAIRATPEDCSVVVAMSGDVGVFSGARLLAERLRDNPDIHVVCLPGISSVQLMAARLGRPWQDWTIASCHGRACDVCGLLEYNQRVFLFTDAVLGPRQICQELLQGGFGAAHVVIGERLGYPDESLEQATAQQIAAATEHEYDALSVVLVERDETAQQVKRPKLWPYDTPGIPDDLFLRTDVPMTKREVRAVVVSHLRVCHDDTIYDIGSGTGSVTVELARIARDATVYAIDRDQAAMALTAANVERFDCHNVRTVQGVAPDVLEDLPSPDCVFIGGTSGKIKQILACVRHKNPQVRICVACIALESISQTLTLLSDKGWTDAQAVQVSIARSRAVGDSALHLMMAQNPVMIISAQGDGTAL